MRHIIWDEWIIMKEAVVDFVKLAYDSEIFGKISACLAREFVFVAHDF